MYNCNGRINPDLIQGGASTRKIIVAANPKSVREISAECRISLSTGHRSVYKLCDCKVLEVHSSIIRSGRRCILFKTKV